MYLFHTKKVKMCLFAVFISIVSMKIRKLLTLIFTQSLLTALIRIKKIAISLRENLGVELKVLQSYKECLFSMLE